MNSTAHVGAAGELFACNYFMNQGLEVCRNVAASGPVDLIVYNKENGRMLPIDVKSHRSVYVRSDGSYSGVNPYWEQSGVARVIYIHGEDVIRLPDGFWEALGMETAE